jgi:hypothetical protein
MYPIIRRVPTANTAATLTGIKALIAGALAAHSGDVFTEGATISTINVTATTWSIGSDAGKYELLTSPQLISEGASNEIREWAWSMTAGDASGPNGFTSLLGVPGLDELPAGIWQFDNELVWIDPATPPSAGSTTTLRWRRLIVDATGVGLVRELPYAESPPIISTTPAFLSYQYLGVLESSSPSYRLILIPELHTTSTTVVTLHLRYNSIGRGTRVLVPWKLDITGAATGRHNDESERDKDVASADPTNADPCHPADAIGAGRLHRNIGVGVVSAGILTMPSDASQCRVTAPANIVGITTTRFLDGDPIMVDFPDASGADRITIANMGDTSSFPTAAPIGLQSVGGVAGGMEISGPTTVYFWRDVARARWRFDRKAATT